MFCDVFKLPCAPSIVFLKSRSLAVTGVKKGWELLQTSISRELSLFDLHGHSLEDIPRSKAIFIRLISDLLGPEAFSLVVVVQKITGNRVTLWLSEMVGNS